MLRIDKLPVLIFALFIAFFPLISSHISAIEHYPDIMIFAGIYSIIAIGLSLFMGYAGQISLAHAAFYGIGAYTSAVLTTSYGMNPWLCMVIGAGLTSFVAYLVGGPSLKLKGHYLAMATLAFGIIVFIIFNEEAQLTGGPDGMTGIPGLKLFGFKLNTIERYYYFVWAIVLLVFIFTVNIIQSSTGRALRAIHSSEAAAMAMGVNVPGQKIIVFVYSAALASLAGSLYAHYLNFVNPSTFDISFGIKLIIMISLGGMHYIWGAIIGAVIITFLSYEWLHFFEEFEILVYGIILLVTTIFLPQGIAGIPNIVKARFKGTP